ncbi:transposase [Streptomyces purpurascens]|uniref:transposase n=1 Tax=Streptomyces purpurascens TaxID=1924 RepID=UPI003C2E2036
MTRAQLTDEEWEFIEPRLPIGEYGPYPKALRQQFEGVIWRFRTGGQWRFHPSGSTRCSARSARMRPPPEVVRWWSTGTANPQPMPVPSKNSRAPETWSPCAGPVTSDTAVPLPRRRPWVPIPCRGRSAPGALRGV